MSEIIIDSQDPGITINPTFTNLNVYTGGYACAQGNTTQVQYNNGGVLAGANGLTYISGNTTTISNNLVVSSTADLGDVGNITITGGNAGEFLQTDGSGGLSFGEIANANYANFAGSVLTNAQPNITSVGTLSNLTVSGNVTATYFIGNGSQLTGIGDIASISNGNSNVRVLANSNVTIGVGGNANVLVATSTGIVVNAANLGNVGNLKITGGNNGFVLQTDGTGNLTWTAMTGNAGNGVVGGSNTQIQYNDSGAFGGSAGFTFNKASNLFSAPGAITAVGNVSGNYILGNGSLLTGIVSTGNSIVNGSSNIIIDANANIRMSVAGYANVVTISEDDANVTGANITVSNGNITIANGIFSGNGSGLSNIVAANITGTVANATHACTANTVTNAAQSNITSLGTLTGLSVNGNIIGGNITSNTGVITGNGSGLSALAGANVTGTVANATYSTSAGSANTAGTVTTAAQPNITSVGTLSSLSVSGNASAGNISTGGILSVTGNASAGNVAGGNLVTANYLAGTLTTAAQPNITSVGTLGNLQVSGNVQASRLISNIANGTAPLQVSSTTKVANLNADFLNGYTWDTSATPTTVVLRDIQASIFANNITGTLTTNAQPNITSVGTLSSLAVTGNVVAGNVYANSGIIGAQNLKGEGGNISNIQGANVSGTVSTASTVTTNAQPNITSVGTLSSLNISGNLSSGNANLGNAGRANYFIGDGGLLSNIFATGVSNGNSNISIIANSNVNISSTGNANVLVITGTGINIIGNINTGTGNIISGNANLGNLLTANFVAGTLTTAAQPNITSVGNLTSLSIAGNIIPTTGNTYNLGNSTNDFRDIRLSNTIFWSNTAYLESVGSFRFSAGGTANALVITAFTTTMNTGSLSVNGVYVKTTSNTVASLGSAIEGARAFVNDGNLVAAGNFGSIIGGGGANKVPVYGDGTNWRIG